MLRCTISRRVLKNSQSSSRGLLLHQQSLGGIFYHQLRPLGFLPIVSSHDLFEKKPSCNTELDTGSEHKITHGSNRETSGNANGGLPAQTTQFSASLADGTIVHLFNSLIDLSEFKDLVLTISKIWKQHSDEIIPHLSAQKIGIGIYKGVHYDPKYRQDVLRMKIFDAGAGKGMWTGRVGLRSVLVKALKSYIGSVDQHGSLMCHSSPVTHAFYYKHQQYEECFMYDKGPYKGEPLSIVLGENAVVTPIPASTTAMTRETLLSVAVPIWQWWRRERPSVPKDHLKSFTNVRIIEVHPTKNFLSMEVWKMSLIPDTSLSRMVHKLFTSDIDGSFKSSIVESNHDFGNLHPGTDYVMRAHALKFLKNNIGWIDSLGNLTEGEYPKLGSLLNKVRGKNPTSAPPQSFLSLRTSTTPEPQALLEGGETRLGKDNGDKAVAVPSPNKTDEAKHTTARGAKAGRDRKACGLRMSATLYDGTLVIPSFKLCQDMEKGVGKGFSSVLQILTQWRAQSREDLKHEYHRKPSLVYVFPERSEGSVDIEIFRKESDWYEQPMTRYKLHHTLPTTGCSYVKFEALPETVLNQYQLTYWKKTLHAAFRYGLKNHVEAVDQTGLLSKSQQPSIHPFLNDLKEPTNLSLGSCTRVAEIPQEKHVPSSSTRTRQAQARPKKAQEVSMYNQIEDGASTEVMESPKERCVLPSPTNTRQEGVFHEEAPKVSMSDQIESVMRLAGDLYEVSTMLNEEISNTPSHPSGNPALDSVDASWMNEPNPVLRTRKHGKINVDAVDRAILKLKAQFRDHEDKAHILAHLCRRWKGELEVEYPLMKRESVSRSGIHNLAIPSSKSSRTKNPVTQEMSPTGPQETATSFKIRDTHSIDKKNDADDNGFSISPF